MQLLPHYFFLETRKLDDVKLINIKEALTSPKGQNFSKEHYAILLGKELFNKGEVRRIDEGKVITKSNLI